MQRMRIDLEGVALKNPQGRVMCIFRFRTTDGLVLAIPESVDVIVPWSAIKEAILDLTTGQIKLSFHSKSDSRPRWLGEVDIVEGEWTDRQILLEVPRQK
ncbi:MAG: hypothetical protein HY819_00875 [Acidobacteria bacterium]|nr:hypothetical protein [Acidobacteriota bacterium]